MSRVFASLVAAVGEVMIFIRHGSRADAAPAMGQSPAIPEARAQGIMTLKMPTARGWGTDEVPVAAAGLKVNALARDLKHPRWLQVLPDGGVLVAESASVPGGIQSLLDRAREATMARAGATVPSANRITLLRDRDGDGRAEERHVYLENLNQPFGMAQLGERFYVGNTDALVAFDFVPGADRLTGSPRVLHWMKPGGHWTRSLLPSPDGSRIYIGVGSLSNIGDEGLEAEVDRAAIHEFDLATETARVFAGGLRNPVGMAWEPQSGVLWTVVNERDGLGDETPPDYLTSVRDGGFYGWPFCYWGQIVDDRVPQDAQQVAEAIQPDYALGGHTASLGLCWLPDGVLPGFGAGMVIGQHGSWNRSKLSGYRVVHVPFADGRPSGPARDILTGFLSEDEKFSRGRPVGVCIGPDGSLLVADDVGNAIWRVTGT